VCSRQFVRQLDLVWVSRRVAEHGMLIGFALKKHVAAQSIAAQER
jgi:hypothetical protein